MKYCFLIFYGYNYKNFRLISIKDGRGGGGMMKYWRNNVY